MRYSGLLYRAVNPVWAREPLSGEGARRHGGRFNAKGTPALYTSTAIMTAIREANQVGTLQPTTLVAYRADVEAIFDATDEAVLGAYDTSPADLARDDWRIVMREHGEAPSQALARRLVEEGFAGIRVRSFAKGATAQETNVVLWRWSSAPPAALVVVDDEGRLR